MTFLCVLRFRCRNNYPQSHTTETSVKNVDLISDKNNITDSNNIINQNIGGDMSKFGLSFPKSKTWVKGMCENFLECERNDALEVGREETGK